MPAGADWASIVQALLRKMARRPACANSGVWSSLRRGTKSCLPSSGPVVTADAHPLPLRPGAHPHRRQVECYSIVTPLAVIGTARLSISSGSLLAKYSGLLCSDGTADRGPPAIETGRRQAVDFEITWILFAFRWAS